MTARSTPGQTGAAFERNKVGLKKLIGGTLVGAGFIGRSPRWVLDGDGVIVVVEIGKSQYDQQHYINIGIALKALDANRLWRAHQCHVSLRAEDLLPGERTLLLEQCNLEAGARLFEDKFVALIRGRLLQAILRASSFSGVKGMYEDGLFTHAALFKTARDLLRQ